MCWLFLFIVRYIFILHSSVSFWIFLLWKKTSLSILFWSSGWKSEFKSLLHTYRTPPNKFKRMISFFRKIEVFLETIVFQKNILFDIASQEREVFRTRFSYLFFLKKNRTSVCPPTPLSQCQLYNSKTDLQIFRALPIICLSILAKNDFRPLFTPTGSLKNPKPYCICLGHHASYSKGLYE